MSRAQGMRIALQRERAKIKELQAWKKLVCDIVQQQDGPHLREMLKELIE